ncbi:MAG: hypothetical protein K8R73_15700 [Clostridiales bacterium]|nr:hypothetical protein [Clostridiales bacterium]MCD4714720.1 hypothetical protein [Clostridiales bacterium]
MMLSSTVLTRTNQIETSKKAIIAPILRYHFVMRTILMVAKDTSNIFAITIPKYIIVFTCFTHTLIKTIVSIILGFVKAITMI